MSRRICDANTEPCDVCGVVISLKRDIGRHAKLHREDRSSLMHKCPQDGCSYQALQKSNLVTHMRQHTGEKPLHCPDCEYRTADPSLFLRHRKRKHGYIPKNSKAKAKPPGSRVGMRDWSSYKRIDSDSDAASPEVDAELSAPLNGKSKASCSPYARLSAQHVHEGALDSLSRPRSSKASGPEEQLESRTVCSSGPHIKSEPFDETFPSLFNPRSSTQVDYSELYIPRSPSLSEYSLKYPSSPSSGRSSPSGDMTTSKALRPSSSLDDLILSIC